MTPQFWRGRHVLITGHTGFKGSWLAAWLNALGASVVGYGLAPPTTPSLFALADLDSRVQSIFADIRDLQRLRLAINEVRPEVIFHLAAQSLVRESYRAPLDTLTTNIIGTANVLEAVRSAEGVQAVVVITSDKCYENREQRAGYLESDPMGGYDPYSSSKGAAELVTSSYRRSFFGAKSSAGIATARAGNVIGGGDFAADRLLPDCIRSVEGERLMLVRNPASTRPWQFVLDLLEGYLGLAERLVTEGPAYAEPWNFGPSDAERLHRPLAMRAICSGARREQRAPVFHFGDGRDVQREAQYLRLDISKANGDWTGVHGSRLMRPIRSDCRLVRGIPRRGDLRGTTIAQIDEFRGVIRVGGIRSMKRK